MKNRLKVLIKEMIPVILGILIALFINNWKADRDNEKFIDTIMKSISEEMKENKTELEDIIKEHQQVLDTIEYYKKDENVAIGTIIGKVKGFRNINIKNTAWKALTNSRIDLVDYKKVLVLTNIDEDKDNMKMQTERLIQMIYENIASTDVLAKELFNIMVRDLLYNEENLLKSQEEFLQLKK